MVIRPIIYILLSAALVSGCSRNIVDDSMAEPTISVNVEMLESKSLISPSNINTIGNTISVYDVHTKTSPTEADQSGSGLVQYLDGQILEYKNVEGVPVWTFVDGDGSSIDIPWTKRGTHNFFAHNTYDASSQTAIPVSVNYLSFEDDPAAYPTEKQQSLSLASWSITPQNQFDFVYASAERDMITSTDPSVRYAPVQMNFTHLFASVAFRILVTSSESITLKSFSIDNLYNTGQATINFDGTVDLVLSRTGTNSDFYRQNLNQLLASGKSLFVHSDIDKIGPDGAFLIWPHSRTNFADVSIYISYTVGKNNKPYTATGKLCELFSVNNWTAGSRYTYTITIADEYVAYDVAEVIDWINNDVDIEER